MTITMCGMTNVLGIGGTFESLEELSKIWLLAQAVFLIG